ncbi:MAG: hypothetical protein F6K09_12275 [Merismopedia sp. SIO2A8]|nr:hypothetical protein [Symploca sp. SIO2B6]NET49471.1 hypothetical protein [Merismopedia sp. SIO2A8]
MNIAQRWQAKPALFMALGLISAAIAPIAAQAPAIANSNSYQVSQLLDSARIVIPAGTVINVDYDDSDNDEEVDKVIIKPDETAPLTLVVENDIRTASGTTLIPAGSTITGELQPLEGDQVGTHFVANELILPNGNEFDLDAVSQPVTRTETITEDSDPDIIKGAVIGAAAAAVLAEILGSIDILEVLGGGALGALGILIFGGNTEEVDVVVVNPDRDLDLTLQSNLRF